MAQWVKLLLEHQHSIVGPIGILNIPLPIQLPGLCLGRQWKTVQVLELVCSCEAPDPDFSLA